MLRLPRRCVSTVVAFLACASAAHAQIPASAEAKDIPGYHLVHPGLATAGQPSPDALSRLKAQGFKTVVNLRTEQEGAREEEAAVKAAGLDYVWVPITAASFKQEDIDAVGKVLDDPKAGPVLLHCASANRVGAVWAGLQVRKGKSFDEAEAEGKKIGLNSPAMIDALRRVLSTTPDPKP